jgi:hypothetical protein
LIHLFDSLFNSRILLANAVNYKSFNNNNLKLLRLVLCFLIAYQHIVSIYLALTVAVLLVYYLRC